MDEGDLAALLRQHAVRHSVPGAAIGVLRDGTATAACYGAADITTGEPITPRTRFSAGSLAKSMVATVIAGLAEAGRLSLDDPVAAHVRELRASGWAGRATLRDLLANRSGLPLRAGLEFGFAGRKESRRRRAVAAGGRRCHRRACGRCVVVYQRGLVRAGAGDRDRGGRYLGACHAAPPFRLGRYE